MINVAQKLGRKVVFIGRSVQKKTEIAYNLGKFASKVQNACYGQCNEDLPEKTCTDNLIVISYSNTSKVYQQDNCIFIGFFDSSQ